MRSMGNRLFFLSSLYFGYVVFLNLTMIAGLSFLFNQRVLIKDYNDYWLIELLIPILLLIDLVFISYLKKCPLNFVFILQWVILVTYFTVFVVTREVRKKWDFEMIELILIGISTVLSTFKCIYSIHNILK